METVQAHHDPAPSPGRRPTDAPADRAHGGRDAQHDRVFVQRGLLERYPQLVFVLQVPKIDPPSRTRGRSPSCRSRRRPGYPTGSHRAGPPGRARARRFPSRPSSSPSVSWTSALQVPRVAGTPLRDTRGAQRHGRRLPLPIPTRCRSQSFTIFVVMFTLSLSKKETGCGTRRLQSKSPSSVEQYVRRSSHRAESPRNLKALSLCLSDGRRVCGPSVFRHSITESCSRFQLTCHSRRHSRIDAIRANSRLAFTIASKA
jgi:hypothetical protein